ncbi:MAG: mannose-1-phosphate guanylyltransferase [Bacteroidia bacterium]|nr:mannose-1-phosphate guanylyltransferase [Bacteroidia bacterium]
MINENNFCVIMAGGVGSRFWPLSRNSRPKQFMDILGTGKTLLQQTFDRFTTVCSLKNIYVVTSSEYKSQVIEQLPQIPEENILQEPFRRNTAPCIAYACYRIKAVHPCANVIVAPSDHLIMKEDEFLDKINEALEFTKDRDALITLGIKPSRPETGYGYIQVSEEDSNQPNVRKVKTFTEKPSPELAKVFMESGEFFWNSGIFIWNLNSILKALETFLPDINTLFKNGVSFYNTNDEESFIKGTYSECRNISIDYGVMEKAKNVYVLCSDFGWSDLGTWGSLYEHSPQDDSGNALKGNNIMMYHSTNCIVNVPDEKLVVIQGLNDYIIVESDGMLLICRKQDEQQIRQIVNEIKIKKGEEYL